MGPRPIFGTDGKSHASFSRSPPVNDHSASCPTLAFDAHSCGGQRPPAAATCTKATSSACSEEVRQPDDCHTGWYTGSLCSIRCRKPTNHMDTWRGGFTPAQLVGGPGFNPAFANICALCDSTTRTPQEISKTMYQGSIYARQQSHNEHQKNYRYRKHAC